MCSQACNCLTLSYTICVRQCHIRHELRGEGFIASTQLIGPGSTTRGEAQSGDKKQYPQSGLNSFPQPPKYAPEQAQHSPHIFLGGSQPAQQQSHVMPVRFAHGIRRVMCSVHHLLHNPGK
jgi:hypothetical protein